MWILCLLFLFNVHKWPTFCSIIPSSSLLFIGSYTHPLKHVPNPKGDGISIYNLTVATDGILSMTHLDSIPHIVNPSYLQISHNKKFLYTITESYLIEDSFIYAIEISTDFDPYQYKFKLIGSWPVGGAQPVHLTIDRHDRFIFVSNFGDGSVTAFKINSDTGQLEPSAFYKFTEFSNVNQERQDGPHLHSSLVDYNMKYVYLAGFGNDCIWRMDYSINKGFDSSSLIKFPSPPGSGPRHMVFHPLLDFLYVSCQLTNRILVYKMDENGILEIMQYEPASIKIGQKSTANIDISEDGRYLYVSTRFVNVIAVFEIRENGQIVMVQEINTVGDIPRYFTMWPAQKLLLVDNQESHSVVAFRIENNGTLIFERMFNVNSPACLRILH